MLTRMLKKDLKRNRTMNIILFLFVIIASLFFASGLYNIVAVSNGASYFLEIGKIGDYQLIALGEDNVKETKEAIDSIDVIKSYRSDECISFSKNDVLDADGKILEVHNVGLLQSVHENGQVFFDYDNNEIKNVEKGKVYISHKFLADNGTKVGDKLTFKKGNVEVELEYAGLCKDAFLGSDFMGNPRFLVNDEVYQKFMKDEEVSRYFRMRTFLLECDDIDKLVDSLIGVNALYSYPASQLSAAYIMNMIVAMLIVILSACLMIVSFVVLKFSITFAIDEDFSEIGVMKAIGIKDRRIRRLYVVKYTFIAIVGAALGFVISIPLAEMLLKFSSETMVLGSDIGLILELIGAATVALLVIFFAYMSTRKIKKLTPVDAVRSGQTGERFKKKGGIRLGKFSSGTSSYLAINDCLSSPKRFLNIVISFTLCMILVLLIVNTTETMNSDKLAYLFGSEADIYITDGEKMTGHMTYDEDITGILDDIAEKERILKENGMPAKVTMPILYNTLVEFNGKTYKFNTQHEYGVPMSEYRYSEGSAPADRNEIAVTEEFMKQTGATIGDSVKFDIGDGEESFLITGTFQSMNNMGKIILLHTDAEPSFKKISSPLQYRINFNDSPDQATIDSRVEKVDELLDVELVQNKSDFCKDSVQVYGTMKMVQRLLLAITIVVVILVTILMERSFITDEKKDIAIAKAIGFRDSRIIKWHVIRILIVAAISMVLAVILSIPMTNLCISPIFGMMGAKDIDYNYGITGLTVYPLIILVVTVITTAITALHTKKITSCDTASLE